MWLPRPMTQRSPIRSTGRAPRSFPGTIPALRLTWGATRVPAPSSIHRWPYRGPVGKPITEPGPNDANPRPAGVSAVILPARWAACQSRCTSRQATARPARATPSLPAMTDKATGLLPARHRLGERERPAAIVRHVLRRQLAARAVDLAAAGVADRHRYAPGLQRRDEVTGRGRGGSGPPRARRRVQRDQVDVGEPAGQQGRQRLGPPGLVVDARDHRVLDRHPAAGGARVLPGRAEYLGHLPAL